MTAKIIAKTRIVTCKYYDQKSKSVEGLVQYIGTRESVALNDDMQAMVGYIGERPGVEQIGKHGLFNGSDEPIDMRNAKNEFTGQEDAFYQMCMVLPSVIEKAVQELDGTLVPRDTVIDELRALASEQEIESDDLAIAMAAYMLGFGTYNGFC